MNLDVIAVVEETPSTLVRMRDGEVVRVQETAAVILQRVQEIRAEVVALGIAMAMRQLSA